MIRKLLLNDGRTERELLLAGTLVVGRDPSCDISDLDPLLSRRHAEFVSNAQGLVVRDLGSRNGILVNGVKVPERKLASGDVVQLGHLHLRYVEDVPPPPAQVKQAEETTATALEAATMLPAALRAAVAQAVPMSRPTDVTMAPGAARAAAAREAGMTMPPAAAREADFEATMLPGAARMAAADLDATLAPGAARGATPEEDTQVPTEAASGEARIVVNTDLVVTESTPAVRALLGVSPESLVGGTAADALQLALNAVSNGAGSSPLSIVAARSTPGGPMTITFTATKAGETAR